MLELEARLERRLGHLELLGSRLCRREAVLELVTRLGEPLCERMIGMPVHPAEELGGRGDRADLGDGLRLPPVPFRRQAGENVAHGGRGDQRPDEMATAALVLSRRALPVLVGADGDVLRPVVRRELARAQRHDRGRHRDDRRQQLPRERPHSRLAESADDDRGAEHRADRPWALHRQPRRRELRLDLRQQQERLGQPGRPAQERALDPRRLETLPRRRDLDPPVLVPDRARPGVRPVHEHAVGQGHAAEPDLLLRHRAEE
jgi:hypothetical protein